MAINNNGSAVDTPDDKKREALKALSDDLGISSMRSDIDSLHDNVAYIRKSMEDMILSWQQFNANQAPPQPQPTGHTEPANFQAPPGLNPIEKAQAISQIVAPLSDLVKAWKGTPTANAVPQQSQLVDIIMNSFTKLMQIQVDNAILNTYPNAANYIKPPTFIKTVSHEPI